MPGWVKALLIVAIIVVVLVVGVVGVGVFVVMRNKDAWIARGRVVAEEGRNFGRTTDNQGCVDEGISRYKKEPGFTSVLSNSLFMRACLESSKPTPGFCEAIPKQTDFFKSAQWKVQQCRQAGLQTDGNCQNLFTPVQQFCETPANHPRDNNSND